MISNYLKYSGLFILAVFAQVVVFDNIYMGGYARVFFYVIFILSLPVEVNRYALMLLGFILGLSIDVFNNTPGMHSLATVTVAFIRPYVLEIYSPRDNYEQGEKPLIYNYGYFWFIKYALTILFIHHFVFYFVEVFRFYNFFITLFKVILSSFLGLTIIIISQLLVIRKRT
jgi:rod shape-determining protein MreD